MDKVYVQGSNDLMMGCDPEFFFSTKVGDILGSEKILKKKGEAGSYSDIVIDGVQAELNPEPRYCRAQIGMNIRQSMLTLNSLVMEKGIEAKFSTAVEVSKEELASLSEGSRTFGCAPSQNLNKDIEGKISVDPATYRYRSAGGHIHLGKTTMKSVGWTDGEVAFEIAYQNYINNNSALDNTEKLVPLLDAILGNTAVLVDRDPMNRERRKVYGKAGEFRTPRIANGKPYDGLEYRTLSNFWLRSYPLMSMVFVLAREAVHVLASSTPGHPFADMVLGAVKRDDIVEAINENKYQLAYRNYKKIESVMTKIINPVDPYSPFTKTRIKPFRYFLRHSVDRWFGKDTLENWTKYEGMSHGFESFLEYDVAPKMGNPIKQFLTSTV